MKYESEIPCDVCRFKDTDCPYDCIHSSVWNNMWQPCANYECMYCDSDVRCDFAYKCGAYIGDGKPNLDFDKDEEYEEDE